MHYNALAANKVMQQQIGPFRCCRGGESAQRGCVRFMFVVIFLIFHVAFYGSSCVLCLSL